MTNRLKELIDSYRDKLAESQINPADADPKVRAGTEAIQRNAVRDLPDLAARYMDEVMKHSVIIGVSGTNSEEFAKIAKYRFKVVSVDYSLALNKMVNNMRKRGVRDAFYNEEYFMTLDEIIKLKSEYGILHLPAPRINHASDQVYNYPLEKALTNLIKTNYGDQLYSVVTRREIGKQALEDRFSGKSMPVVLYNYNGGYDESLLPRPILTVDANGKIDEKFVQSKLNEVKAKLNPRPKNKTEQLTEEKTQESTQTEENSNVN